MSYLSGDLRGIYNNIKEDIYSYSYIYLFISNGRIYKLANAWSQLE